MVMLINPVIFYQAGKSGKSVVRVWDFYFSGCVFVHVYKFLLVTTGIIV